LQNGKESKECRMKIKLNYFSRNETNGRIVDTRSRRKKAVITYYSDTSLATAPKSDGHQYCSKNVATLGLPALLY